MAKKKNFNGFLNRPVCDELVLGVLKRLACGTVCIDNNNLQNRDTIFLNRKWRYLLTVRVEPPSLLSSRGFAQLCVGLPSGCVPCYLFLLLSCAKQQSCLLFPFLGFLKSLFSALPGRALIKYLLWKLFWQTLYSLLCKGSLIFCLLYSKGLLAGLSCLIMGPSLRSYWGLSLSILNTSSFQRASFLQGDRLL